MKLHRVAALALLVGGCLRPALFAAETNSTISRTDRTAERYSVEVLRYEWFDASRNRKVPVKIYYPNTSDGVFPVIIFSHGLGGSREGYEYLGRHWAACGYVSVHVQHLGSDNRVWQDAAPGEA